MASKAIKISEEFIQIARVEGKIMLRSAGAQVEFWARLGRKIESRELLGASSIRELMSGRVSIQDLTTAEDSSYMDALAEELESLDGSDTRLLDELREAGHPVASTNKNGQLIIEHARSSEKRSS